MRRFFKTFPNTLFINVYPEKNIIKKGRLSMQKYDTKKTSLKICRFKIFFINLEFLWTIYLSHCNYKNMKLQIYHAVQILLMVNAQDKLTV